MAPGQKPNSKSDAPKRRARGSLSRPEILAVARQLIEMEGLQALTFPSLAEHLNSGASSIYSYFENKEALVAAVIDDVTTEMYLRLPGVGDGPWNEEVVAHFAAFRGLLQQTPVYREVFSYQAQTLFHGSRMAPFILRRVEENLELFVRAGLTIDEAVSAFNAFSSFTRAFALVEHGMQEDEDERVRQLNQVVMMEVAAELPLVRRIDDLSKLRALGDDLYLHGLSLLVAGLCSEYPHLAASANLPRLIGNEMVI